MRNTSLNKKAFGKQSKAFFLLICFFCFSGFASAQNSARISDYPLGSGDKIRITVFGEEDLSMEVTLSDAGTISYPFLGEIDVLGRTIGGLSQYITEGLLDGYLISPNVSVTVLEYRPFYIHGEVETPGGYPYQPGLTLQQAVALAGGFTERASRSKFMLLKEGAEDESEEITVRLTSPVGPGDTVTIEESFF